MVKWFYDLRKKNCILNQARTRRTWNAYTKDEKASPRIHILSTMTTPQLTRALQMALHLSIDKIFPFNTPKRVLYILSPTMAYSQSRYVRVRFFTLSTSASSRFSYLIFFVQKIKFPLKKMYNINVLRIVSSPSTAGIFSTIEITPKNKLTQFESFWFNSRPHPPILHSQQ